MGGCVAVGVLWLGGLWVWGVLGVGRCGGGAGVEGGRFGGGQVWRRGRCGGGAGVEEGRCGGGQVKGSIALTCLSLGEAQPQDHHIHRGGQDQQEVDVWLENTWTEDHEDTMYAGGASL